MSLLSYVINLPAKLGRAASAGSVSVTLASDDAAVTALAAIESSTGASSTAANQTTANTILAAIISALAGVLSVNTANKQVSGNLTVADPTGVVAGSTVTINTDSLGALGIKLSGTPVGATVLFQGSIDGVTWDNPKAYPLTVGAAGVQSATAAGDFEVNCAAFKQFRVCLSTLTSGSFVVSFNGTAAPKHVGVKNGNAADLQVTSTAAYASLTDRSGTVATGGTAQQLAAANPTRKGWRLQNTSSGDLWFNDTGGSAGVGGTGCFKVAAGGYYETPVGGASQTSIGIFGATATQTFSASEW